MSEQGGGKFDPNTFNWAPVMVGIVFIFSAAYWVLSARKWFTGPALDVATVGVVLAENVEGGLVQEMKVKEFEVMVLGGGNGYGVGESGEMLLKH
ncbi:hypothetical protein HDV00_011323 [Rhizophlyctis rosea]|nr:hypothetical protein HDV00_011323 [Rhizophlyctis rosea]